MSAPFIVWQALADIDQTEGRGGLKSIGIFREVNEARDAADGRGVQGFRGEVVGHWAITSEGETYILGRAVRDDGKAPLGRSGPPPQPIVFGTAERLAEEALAKLLPAERRAVEAHFAAKRKP